jgi:thiamine-monophosphate kinase
MNDSFLSSEQDFLALIDRYFSNDHAGLSLGRGDDCAVFTCPGSLCVTTDLFVEDVHFRRSYFSPGDIGHKALAVNLSDLAAMGATPLGFSLALVAPREIFTSFWDAFFRAMAQLATRYDLVLTGGDLSGGEKIVVGITAWGAPTGKVLTRGQTRVGDILFVVGNLGLARTGLLVLEKGLSPASFPQSVKHHHRPDPKVDQGRILSGMPGVRGIMDVSDGLDQDLPRFLAAGQGADMAFDPAMIHPEVMGYCANHGLDPARFCLRGGEDYALLGAVEPGALESVLQRVPEAWPLGTVTEGGFHLQGRQIELQGFDHFAKNHRQP